MKIHALVDCLGVCALAIGAYPARAAAPAGVSAHHAMVYVVQADNTLLEFDAADFHRVQAVVLPLIAKGHPECISVSPQGSVMVGCPDTDDPYLRRFWQSDRPAMPPLAGSANHRSSTADGGSVVASDSTQLHFASDPGRLFWFENRKQILNREGLDISVATVFASWTTDRKGEDPRKVVEVSFPPCACTTGSCEESCPEVAISAPESGIADYFFATRWVPGQLQPDFQQTELYRLENEHWVGKKLSAPVARFTDMADHGNAFIEIVSDGGCCGWENEGDDQTLLVRGGRPTVIYDERRHFRNEGYEVSFFTSRARLSPDGSRVAYTLVSSLPAGEELRRSDSRNGDPGDLRRMQKAIGELPRVELIAVSDPEKVTLTLPGELVAWLDGKRILLVQAEELVVVDAATGTKTKTGIKAPSAQHVFVR